MTRSGTVERAYVDTLSLRDPNLVVRYVVVVTLLFTSLLLTAHWAGSPQASRAAGAVPTAVVVEAAPAFGPGIERASGTAR